MSGYENVLSTLTRTITLRISYGEKNVIEGQELRPGEAKDSPAVDWDADENALYTLAMIDPDQPSRHTASDREMRHWLVANIPGSRVQEGDVITPYMGPAPGSGTGEHRYVFALFKQPDRVVTEKLHNDQEGRKRFSTEAWAKKNYLLPAVAAIHFKVQG